MVADLDLLVWVDTETTGLDVDVCWLLEVGIIVTDSDLREVARQAWVCRPPDPTWESNMTDPVVRDMHEASGLLPLDLAAVDYGAVERQAVALLDELVGPGRATLAGSSVHYDAAVLRRHMPALASRFGHRHFDISVLSLAGRRWAPEHWATRPAGATAHRTLADLDHAIASARHWRTLLTEAA